MDVHVSRRALLIACAILLVASVVLWREIRLIPRGHLQIHLLDVGQGDAALLVSPSGRTVLIDGGPDLSALEQMGKVLPLSDRSIDLLILSHPDPDHFTAFTEILRRYEVGALMIPPTRNTEAPFRALLSAARERNVPVIVADPARDFLFGDGLMLDILWPPVQAIGTQHAVFLPLDDNDSSIVLRASFGTGSILFTGDISEKAESLMLSEGTDVSALVLKVSHHGSKTATSPAFLSAVAPRFAVISVGKENTYGHPSPETMGRLAEASIPVRMTMSEGAIDLEF